MSQLAAALRAEAIAKGYAEDGPSISEEIEGMVGFTTGEHIWTDVELFGMVVDHDCPGQPLDQYYKYWETDKPTGTWYFPGDDVVIETVSLDSPPKAA